MNGDLSYNSNSLQTFDPATATGIVTNVIRHTDMPESSGDVVPLAHVSDSVAPSSEYPNRLVRLGGTIHGSSQADLDTRIDSFKAIFVQREKNLDIAYGSGTRRYRTLKVNSLGIERQDKALFATFSVEIICKPFGTETTATTIANVSNRTDASYTVTPTIGGTAPYQLPIITITIDALTGEGDFLQVSNDLNGQEIILAGLGLEAGDVVVINAETRKVTVDDVEVDYSGTFIELEPGAQSFTITDGFDTRSVDILIEYYKRYM